METVTTQPRLKIWALVKAGIIGVIFLILQIPAFLIQDLVKEREAREKEAVMEISSKWALSQEVEGPAVIIPYWETVPVDSITRVIRRKQYLSVYPDKMNFSSSVSPIEKHRGIYKAILYNSTINCSGLFNGIDMNRIRVQNENLLWNEAFVKMNVSDVQGLSEELKINWNDTVLNFSTESPDHSYTEEGLFAPLPLSGPENLKNAKFTTSFNLKGSSSLLFNPTGKETTVEINSKWPHPSFTGNLLPNTTNVSDSGFTASWKSMAHNRSKAVTGVVRPVEATEYEAGRMVQVKSPAAFGASLYMPVSNYQKTHRSIKYASLCILLTFAAFYIVETTTKKEQLHPFQYGLVGLALVVFYTLLLSFSEYTGFNLAYGIASLCTVGLVAWFVRGIFSSSKATTILASVLMLIYAYVFTILQLQDYALLVGSTGLFITLGIIMHFSKKMSWS